MSQVDQTNTSIPETPPNKVSSVSFTTPTNPKALGMAMESTTITGSVSKTAKSSPWPSQTIQEEKEEDEDDDHDSQSSSTSSQDGIPDMPLLKYARLTGSLSRHQQSKALTKVCTACTLGRISASAYSDVPHDKLWVLVMGFMDGSIQLVDSRTGLDLLNPKYLCVETHPSSDPHRLYLITAVSMDASGTTLAACQRNGAVAIWDLKWVTSEQDIPNSATAKLYNKPPSTKDRVAIQALLTSGPLLLHNPSSPFRFSYGLQSTPTCLVLDPAYSKRHARSTEGKQLLTGFSNGKLVLTKRNYGIVDSTTSQPASDESYGGAFLGGLWSNIGTMMKKTPTTDQVLYVASASSPMEAVAWRGNLAAFADSTGIKLLDTETWTRLAHIDRPVGADVSLYKQYISSIKCNMTWETSTNLLVAWGDCLMTLKVTEHANKEDRTTNGTSLSTDTSSDPSPPLLVTRKRSVECSMAWELDCVACGVAPMDSNHVVVFGIVQSSTVTEPVVQLQIISRNMGTMVASNAIPMLLPDTNGSWSSRPASVAASELHFLCSYTTARCDSKTELAESLGLASAADLPTFQYGSLLPTSSFSSMRTPIDMYQHWSLDRVLTSADALVHPDLKRKRVLEKRQGDPLPPILLPHPPILVLCAPSDVILGVTNDVDDAIAHAKTHGDAKLALLRGWNNLPLVKKFSLDYLVNEYLISLVKQPSTTTLKLAAQSTEVLLRGNVDLWEKWICVFSKLPGGLYALREYIPVRDPMLFSTFYEMVLMKMLVEIEAQKGDSVIEQAKDIFLQAMLAWGPISAITERIRLMRWRHSNKSACRRLAIDMYRRRHQKAMGVALEDDDHLVHLLSGEITPESVKRTKIMVDAGIDYANEHVWSKESTGRAFSPDSLFDMVNLASKLVPRMTLMYATKSDLSWNPTSMNVVTEALAELSFMRGEYIDSLRLYLLLSANSTAPRLDEKALKSVQKGSTHTYRKSLANHPHEFVLAMIEHHNLFSALLDASFLPVIGVRVGSTKPASNDVHAARALSPLVALIHLVGLDLASQYLIEHCVSSDGSSLDRGPIHGAQANLPLQMVAMQLSGRPKLLFWYLHQIFLHRPEVYVDLSHMAVPPKEILDLHRSHFDLHVKYHLKDGASRPTLIPSTAVIKKEAESPLLTFLRVVMPYGGVRAQYARKLIEQHRKDAFAESIETSSPKPEYLFARELAFVMEQSGRCTEKDANTVLNLYLEGAKSLSLAVAYAESNIEHSVMLWEKLVSYCLNPSSDHDSSGRMFGALLEAAAQSGADLAHLVSKIPEGMHIKGLRPMLVAAVGDYRFRVKMHESALDSYMDDKVELLKELTHRANRAVKVVGALSLAELSSLTTPRFIIAKHPAHRAGRLKHVGRTLEERQYRIRRLREIPLR